MIKPRSLRYQTYSYHPAPPPPPPPPPPHVPPYDKYYPRGATYHLYPPYSGGQYAAPGAEYSYPPPPPGGVHYSQESYTSYTLCVPNPPPQGPPQALALPPPPPPTSNAPHPPAYATYHYTELTPVFTTFIHRVTICFPVDPKTAYGPLLEKKSVEGQRSSGSNVEECSSMNQVAVLGTSTIRPAQHQNHPHLQRLPGLVPAASCLPQCLPAGPSISLKPAATTTLGKGTINCKLFPINPWDSSSPQSVGSPHHSLGGASAQAVSGSTNTLL
ncbi:inverted formin-2-like [Penaeus monodon]|uniref:inverted formin-2-like n=1 Tax=Penaeus monodon TaxID=6687 RepID=UPI0018A7D417|nr:inverted formin-2-like [Penaeus monodon]